MKEAVQMSGYEFTFFTITDQNFSRLHWNIKRSSEISTCADIKISHCWVLETFLTFKSLFHLLILHNTPRFGWQWFFLLDFVFDFWFLIFDFRFSIFDFRVGQELKRVHWHSLKLLKKSALSLTNSFLLPKYSFFFSFHFITICYFIDPFSLVHFCFDSEVFFFVGSCHCWTRTLFLHRFSLLSMKLIFKWVFLC